MKMKKLISIILALAMIFAFTACGDGGETQNGGETENINAMPDYEKIQVWFSSSGAMIYTPKNHEELVEYLRNGFTYTQRSLIIANVDYLPSDFDGIDYTEYNPLSMGFDMLDFSMEEIALRVEKLVTIQGVKSVICTYDYGRPLPAIP